MSAQAMLSMTTDLNIQPGEIPPTIHVKQGSNSLAVTLRIDANNATLQTGGTAVIKGARPDGAELFFAKPITDMDAAHIMVDLASNEFTEMTLLGGCYRCAISIIDTEETVTQENYEEFELVTVQPFLLDVQAVAAE